MAAPSYNSVIQKLTSFTVANAANRGAAEAMVEEFMNEIRPEIDQVLRENPNLTQEQKRALDEKEAAIHAQINLQFGGKRVRSRRGRKTRAAKLRKQTQRKTRSRKGTRKH